MITEEMRHGSLFSGIGGFDLAAQWMGWENVFHCEWNEFGQKVLKYYWPNAISYDDITKTDFSIHRGTIDILTGGFPCQPYSAAGKRLGKEDSRHLWPEMLRAIREIQPTWVVGENVLGLVNWNGGLVFDEVQADLEAEGYEVQPYVLPAVCVNAPHRRDRVWFVAYSDRNSRRSAESNINEEGQHIQCRSSRSCLQRTTSDTSSNGLYDESTKRYNSVRQDNQQSRTQRERTAEGFGNEWSSSDTDSERGGILRNEIETAGTRESNELFGCEHSISNESESANTNNERLQGCEINGSTRGIREERNKFITGCIPSTWDKFPTQSPVCSRDDGISDRLDSITFPKWRNESIKAGGNAIVPQVVFQIFKAIEKYNDSISDQ